RVDPAGTGAAGVTRAWELPATGGQAVSTIARDAIELFTGPFADRIRACGADNCELVFVDTSRPGRRRWCSMEHCGNRHKVRALRARRGSEGAGAAGAADRAGGSGGST
ncbi:CGNR zinc finger domain-containing protein, partial [Streptomyces sp. SID3343]|uniref:CGNR zinc finger domain-containing protein n=1 Tax=Streptomyces sp. SID3343 TaxID=2690260 RepID=UPI00136D8FD8